MDKYCKMSFVRGYVGYRQTGGRILSENENNLKSPKRVPLVVIGAI